ncbi:PH domain-containing protein [Sporichthya polymorpha]|uniref:PH domain-containing protein n=1 Tax=Sporichthya polymorpha TaxID=35751 RepID=UPI0003824FE6|nr:PH domain-containing protein [Sporichthya polymorpha]
MDPFALEDRWTPVSPRLRSLRLTVLTGVLGTFALLAVGVGALTAVLDDPTPGLIGAGVALVVLGGLYALGRRLIRRNYEAWGYSERDEDLLVVRGWLFRRLVVVPYGRMQFVDVTAGPLERRFNLATVQLHTAAAASDARIPGLPPDEAQRLRDTLARLGEARSAGL